MLSNPTNLHQRQRQHRRQKSTPTAFEAPKVPLLPLIPTNGHHRRGMSLDQRQRRQPSPQENNTVSTTNNGFHQTQQHILREAQQQRLARPGQQQQAPRHDLLNDENYLISPLASPQSQCFETEYLNSYGEPREHHSPYRPYSGQINTIIKPDLSASSGNNHFSGDDPILFTDDGIPSAYLDFSGELGEGAGQENWGTIRPSTRPPSGRRVSGGIADRVAMFEGMIGEQSCSRPITPSTQNASSKSKYERLGLISKDANDSLDYFPPTPATTPFNHGSNLEPVPQRFLESYGTSMEETIRPSRSRSNPRTRNMFQEMREQAELNNAVSPPGPLPATGGYDSAPIPTSDFMNMSNLNLDFMKSESGPEPSQYSPTTPNYSPQMSHHSSPEISHTPFHGDLFESKPNFGVSETSIYPPLSPNHGQSPRMSSPHQTTVLDDIDLAESITDTGITIDDIACYIEGPDAVDQKWTCLFPECKKRFGRKENIKSHVQTHLGDRQYQCPHCKKCFVRQHDLKRHAKIHSGVKPYPCLCGNSFARHDALTRHRQRGMCIGAFEGVVKKVVKRGRPRKNRPDIEERLDKASRTRSKNKTISSASSTSGYSESSFGNSPPATFEILDDKPFRDFTNDYSQPSVYMDNSTFPYSSAPSPMPTDYVSPQAIQNAPSPSAFSNQSHQSFHSQHSQRGSIDYTSNQNLPALPASPAKSVASYYNTPPELCLSSSSPPPSNALHEVSQPPESDDLDLSKLAALQNIDLSTHDDEMFLDFGSAGDMGTSRLEQDPGLLLMGGKFDDAFGEWDAWT
jgi:regulatory protein SWI5